jgi:serine protease Do
VKPGSAAARLGVRAGDVVLSYNGEPVRSERHFYRLVLDGAPGSFARLGLLSAGTVRVLEVPVHELDIMPRA